VQCGLGVGSDQMEKIGGIEGNGSGGSVSQRKDKHQGEKIKTEKRNNNEDGKLESLCAILCKQQTDYILENAKDMECIYATNKKGKDCEGPRKRGLY